MIRRLFFAAAMLAACGLAGTVSAEPVFDGTPGAPVILPTGGTVRVTFLEYIAGYENSAFYVTAVSPVGGTFLFDRNTGGSVDLPGVFAALSEVIFRLDVDTDPINSPGIDYHWYTGPASRNVDNFAHGSVADWVGNTTQVGFEDIYGGGDKDYNDMVFQVEVLPVPEPASVLAWSMIGGTFGLAIWRRNKKNAS